MLTHANLLGEVEAVFAAASRLGPATRSWAFYPCFTCSPRWRTFCCHWFSGARVVYLETLNTTELLRALRERDITAFAVVPQFFYLIHERIFKEAAQTRRADAWSSCGR